MRTILVFLISVMFLNLEAQFNPFTFELDYWPQGVDAVIIDEINDYDYDDDEDIEGRMRILNVKPIMEKEGYDYLVLDDYPGKLYTMKKPGRVEEWDIIIQRNEYYLLCPYDINDDYCNCRNYVHLFIPDKNFPVHIYKWYLPPFPKRDLIRTINEQTSDFLVKEDFHNYCEIISFLRN